MSRRRVRRMRARLAALEGGADPRIDSADDTCPLFEQALWLAGGAVLGLVREGDPAAPPLTASAWGLGLACAPGAPAPQRINCRVRAEPGEVEHG